MLTLYIAIISIVLNFMQTAFFFFKSQKNQEHEKERSESKTALQAVEAKTEKLSERIASAERRLDQQDGYVKRISEELTTYNNTLSAMQAQLTTMSNTVLTKDDFYKYLDLIVNREK